MELDNRDSVGRLLLQLQKPSGGWSSLTFGSQVSIETTALATIASRLWVSHFNTAGIGCLVQSQHRNGSWPAFIGDDQQGSWVTSLALLALGREHETARHWLKGCTWLLSTSGRESHWFWKWKFRTSDSHVRFDPTKYGWPWHPGANSWVVPTAFSLLALRQLPYCRGFRSIEERVNTGTQMLFDRTCPLGGWNAGNGVAYGVALAPHPDDTAIALLALAAHSDTPVVIQSVSWLATVAVSLSSPWSLGWTVLALAAHRQNVDGLVDRLASMLTSSQIQDIATLAVGLLALDHQTALEYFGVV